MIELKLIADFEVPPRHRARSATRLTDGIGEPGATAIGAFDPGRL